MKSRLRSIRLGDIEINHFVHMHQPQTHRAVVCINPRVQRASRNSPTQQRTTLVKCLVFRHSASLTLAPSQGIKIGSKNPKFVSHQHAGAALDTPTTQCPQMCCRYRFMRWTPEDAFPPPQKTRCPMIVLVATR